MRFLIAACMALVAAATADAAQWVRSYGDAASISAVWPADDGGHVVAGGLGLDPWVAKLDATGAIVWQRAWHSPLFSVGRELARAILPTPDGGFLVAGDRLIPLAISFADQSGWLQKVGPDGRVGWQRLSGGSASYRAIAAAYPAAEGRFVVVGTTDVGRYSPGHVLAEHIDAGGNTLWRKTYGGTGLRGYANSVQATPDGGFVVAGFTCCGNNQDAWVLRLDASGNVLWQKAYGGSGSDYANSVQPTTDGGFVVAGGTDSFGAGSLDAWVLKLDVGGNMEWQKTLGGGLADSASSVHPTTDGSYVVAGTTSSFSSSRRDQAWLFKLDARSNVAWQRTYGDDAVSAGGVSMRPTADGGYIVAASHFVLKVGATGAVARCALAGVSNAVARDGAALATTTSATVAPATGPPVVPLLESYVSSATAVSHCDDPSPASRLTAVEYHHRDFGHYFVTADAAEVAKLDAGDFNGWARTGQSFQVYGVDPGAASVCRFWSGQTFAPKSSHFYTPYDRECAEVRNNPDWTFEKLAFGLQLPVLFGACPSETLPLYRAYNGGRGGAPNHRYTTSASVRDEMLAQGWIPEGFTIFGVSGCVPNP